MKVEAFSAVEPTWQELFEQTPNATPFVSYEWFRCLAVNLLKADPGVLLIESKGRVICIIPATITGGVLRSIGDDRVTDLYGMVYVPAHENAIIRCLAEYLNRNKLMIDLYPLERDNLLVNGLRSHRPGLTVQKKDKCPLLDLPGTWDEYLAGLDSKARHELRRKMKKVNGAILEDVKSEDIEGLFQLMSRSDEKKKQFLKEDMMSFFRELAEAFGKRGWLRMRRLVIDGQALGMTMAFRFDHVVYLFNMGIAPEMRSVSPGIVTLALDIRAAIEENGKSYDFMRGDEDYKYRLGAKERYTVRING
jgi:CelD/BcsL family acetyltransferase involved in cellulose biosynthesis